jgi:hypothetical protein
MVRSIIFCLPQRTIVLVRKSACQYVSLRFTQAAFHLIAFATVVGGQHAVIALARDWIMVTADGRCDGSPPPTPDSSKTSPPWHWILWATIIHDGKSEGNA